jgi:catechol 2,3-dioxygenase-like lactoylglutathione lyase family enzyme
LEQRVSLITLGVADLTRSRTFYEGLGWRGHEVTEAVFFQAGGLALVLWAREKLAADSGVPDRPRTDRLTASRSLTTSAHATTLTR